MQEIKYIQVWPQDEKMCRTFEELVYAYIAEMNEHSHRPLPEKYQKKWIDCMIAAQGAKDCHLEVCWLGEEPLGFLYGRVDHEGDAGFVKPGYGYILEFFVRPAYRRQGHGTRMFKRLESLFRRDGVRKMYLTADPVTGKPFWEALGFAENGELSPVNQLNVYERALDECVQA